jgi:hypothetical protein
MASETTPNSLDTSWYERLTAITQKTGETFERLMPPLSEIQRKRQAFEASGYTENPDLTARHLEVKPLAASRNELRSLREDVAKHETNEYIRDAYVMRIDELIANHDMLLASAAQDMKGFKAANEAIYGKPDTDVFGAVCQWIRHEAEQSLEDTNLGSLAKQVLNEVPDIKDGADTLTPDEKLFRDIRAMHHEPGGYYEQLFGADGLPAQNTVTQAEGDVICQRILQNIGSDYSLGYATNGLWAVLPSVKQVMRPPNYKLDREAFIGIVSHEIGSHLLETVNGEKQPLKLLSSALAGMDRFELGNEGRAFLREQIVYESTDEYTRQPSWHYCIAIHMTVSLAAGLYDHPYSFHEVYKVLVALYRFWNEKNQPGEPGGQADDAAWHMALRVLKGTDGTGDAYRKDIVYLEGNIRYWKLAETQPELILLGDSGKFDIANPRHIRILEGLGIIKTLDSSRPRPLDLLRTARPFQ